MGSGSIQPKKGHGTTCLMEAVIVWSLEGGMICERDGPNRVLMIAITLRLYVRLFDLLRIVCRYLGDAL